MSERIIKVKTTATFLPGTTRSCMFENDIVVTLKRRLCVKDSATKEFGILYADVLTKLMRCQDKCIEIGLMKELPVPVGTERCGSCPFNEKCPLQDLFAQVKNAGS